MRVEIQQLPAGQIAAFSLRGPWNVTVPQGFALLTDWVSRNRLKGEWLAVYHDNPQEVPAERLRVDTGIGVPAGFTLPQDSEGVTLKAIPSARYAVAQVKVSDGDFARPWNEFFDDWLPASGYRRASGPCFDRYLNDGSQSGVWDMLICIPVERCPE